MSCYFRHLKTTFDEVGIEVTLDNRKQIDQAIHRIVGTNFKDCPGTWQIIKNEIIPNDQKRQDFINKLSAVIK